MSVTGEHSMKLTKNQLKVKQKSPPFPPDDASPQLGLNGVFVSLEERT